MPPRQVARASAAKRVFRKGDVPTGLYVVVYGAIKLVSGTATGAERLRGIVGPGQSLGARFTFSRARSSA